MWPTLDGLDTADATSRFAGSSWWVSDTVSAFLITPVILAWTARAPVWRSRRSYS
jgi:hypothetical protein